MINKTILRSFNKLIINSLNTNRTISGVYCTLHTDVCGNKSENVAPVENTKQPGVDKPPSATVDKTEFATHMFIDRTIPNTNKFVKPRQAWIVNMDNVEESIISLINLHPDVYGARPRIDIIKENVVWQRKYGIVDFRNVPVGHEVNKSTRKPWPQKGLGKARHGTRRSHIFLGGGKLHGPRDPTSHFYMLPFPKRVAGLCSTLSVKLAQDDLHIVQNLEIPSENPQYILDLTKYRNWGPSVLFVDVDDIMPKNIAMATDPIKYINLMPVYGLNVYSMLKHETVVLTLAAALKIEERLLTQLYGSQLGHKIRKYKREEHIY